MRLLLLGYAGYGNVGDEALLGAQAAALRAHLPGAVLQVVSGCPAQTTRVHGLAAVSRTDPVALARAVRSCDVLVAGGGSLLQDVTSPRPVAFYGGMMLAAAQAGKLVAVYAQGLGPLRQRGARVISARSLAAAHYLSLRDAGSLTLAEQLGIIGAELVADPVLAMRPPELADLRGPADLREPASARTRLAVAVRPWGQSRRWLAALVCALMTLADRVEVVLVPMHAGQDVEIAHVLADRLRPRFGPGLDLVEPDGGYAASTAALQGADVVLGMRLHALVIGAAAGVPIVAISYDPKVAAFAAQVGLDAVLDTEELATDAGANVLRCAVEQALAWDAARLGHYRERIGQLAELADLPARRIADLVTGRSPRSGAPGRMRL